MREAQKAHALCNCIGEYKPTEQSLEGTQDPNEKTLQGANPSYITFGDSEVTAYQQVAETFIGCFKCMFTGRNTVTEHNSLKATGTIMRPW